MQEHYSTKGKHLTYLERKLIYKWHNEKMSNRQITKLLGKSPQAINNEINRETVILMKKKNVFVKKYNHDYAQNRYTKKRSKCVKKSILTDETIERIKKCSKNKISPEMMVKRFGVSASQSSIYYWFHNNKLSNDVKLLYTSKKKKDKWKVAKNMKKFGKSIDERPDYINLRLEYGHFEIDTVILTKAKNYCLLTLVDRFTRVTIIRLIDSKTARAVNNALKEILKHYDIKSITADNWSEFARLSEVFDDNRIYYAHPYCSWERGTNENHNRLIRRWIPKGTEKTTPEEVAFIEN